MNKSHSKRNNCLTPFASDWGQVIIGKDIWLHTRSTLQVWYFYPRLRFFLSLFSTLLTRLALSSDWICFFVRWQLPVLSYPSQIGKCMTETLANESHNAKRFFLPIKIDAERKCHSPLLCVRVLLTQHLGLCLPFFNSLSRSSLKTKPTCWEK